jgi:hypothetical protein
MAEVTVTLPVVIAVHDDLGAPKGGLMVYAFNGSTYTNYSARTDEQGMVSMTLPPGEYRFRADFNGTEFWSSQTNQCSVLGCSMAAVTVTRPVTVTVLDTDGAPKSGVAVYTFNGSTYSNFSGTTDAQGQATLTLPAGDYRFQAVYNGTQFWSSSTNHCSVSGCINATITVTNDVIITVQEAGEGAELLFLPAENAAR